MNLFRAIITLVISGAIMLFCVKGIISMAKESKAASFSASCEFYGGYVKQDSYGNLHCVPKGE